MTADDPAVRNLLTEVRRLKGELDHWQDHYTRRDREIHELRAELDRERERADRLKQGIRDHAHAKQRAGRYRLRNGLTTLQPASEDDRLWALLDSDGPEA